MLTYKAMYKEIDGGIHAEVLDFPGVITSGRSLDEARGLLAGALVDMAEALWLEGESLPSPDPSRTDAGADLEEPIHLLLTASSRVSMVPDETPREAASPPATPQPRQSRVRMLVSRSSFTGSPVGDP